MLYDYEIDDLPSEPESAFIRVIEILDEKLKGRINDDWLTHAKSYAYIALAFIDEHQLDIGIDIQRSVPTDEYSFRNWFDDFQNKLIYVKTRMGFRKKKIRKNDVPQISTVALNLDRKSEIHQLLEKVRKVVANLDVSTAKREAIYDRINALSAEVDKERTRLDVAMDFILEITETAGQAAENLEPIVKLAEKVRKVFGAARMEENPPALPPPENSPKQIEGPKSDEAVDV